MKVLLIQPPHYFEGGSRVPDSFPLGLAYLGRALLDAGHKVEVLNIWQHQYTDLETRLNCLRRSFDVCGITALSTQYSYVKRLMRTIREVSDAKIIVGGALATFNSSLVLEKTDANYCVCGEGERKIVDLLSKPFSPIKSAYYGQSIKNIDSIPFPAWHLFDLDFYLQAHGFYGSKSYISMNMISSRGCPYHCHFCSKVFEGVRLRSIENIVSEIKELIRTYGVECIKFDDELVMLSKDRMLRLCEAIKPLGIKFVCNGRTNIVDRPLLQAMKESGCLAVGYGVESGSQTILDAMNKQTTVAQGKQAILDTVHVGIFPVAYMMFGFPGETSETLKETIDFFKDIPFLGDKISLAITTPLPGSELYEQCLKDGKIMDEEEYHQDLAGGYLRFGGKMLVNFTGFDDPLAARDRTEEEIFRNQVYNDPLRYLWIMAGKAFRKFRRILKAKIA